MNEPIKSKEQELYDQRLQKKQRVQIVLLNLYVWIDFTHDPLINKIRFTKLIKVTLSRIHQQ